MGTSGSGKTTIARRIAATLGVPYLELDSLYHQAGWQPLDADEFRSRVDEVAAQDAWVIDGNYSEVRDIAWSRADTVVWLDPPQRVVMRRVSMRSFSRAVTRRELWNGNRESWRNLASRDPERSIIRWSWTSYAVTRDRYERAMADPRWAGLQFARLRTRREARAWITALADQVESGSVTP